MIHINVSERKECVNETLCKMEIDNKNDDLLFFFGNRHETDMSNRQYKQ